MDAANVALANQFCNASSPGSNFLHGSVQKRTVVRRCSDDLLLCCFIAVVLKVTTELSKKMRALETFEYVFNL